MRIEILCIAVTALMWGGYPLLARSSGVGTPIGALILTGSALIPISIVTVWYGVAARPAFNEIGKLIVAGMMMGLGTAAFNFVANSRQIDASISIPIVDTTMLLVTVVAAIAFFAEPITTQKVIGIVLLLAGIVVLNRA
ncbi:MAG TPA: EamA family transporter [Steroidobacteraceae bacterium]|nr:EamA family transporter [Steroidobacteraceae bacterium]